MQYEPKDKLIEKSKAKPDTSGLKLRGRVAKEGTCFHCGKKGH